MVQVDNSQKTEKEGECTGEIWDLDVLFGTNLHSVFFTPRFT